MNLTEEQIFEHAFVVSVEDKRLEAFRKQFALAGFKKIPEHWHGAFINKSLFAGFENKPTNMLHYKYVKSLCNGFSHYFLVVMAKYMDWPFVTIFEDDAVPIEDIHEKIKFYCSDIPDNVDIFKLGYLRERTNSKILYEDDKFIGINQMGSHAYIVFKKNYDRFIAETVMCPRADFFRFNMHDGMNSYSPKISLFKQVNVPGTDIIHSFKR